MNNKRASVLVIALWSLCLLTVFSVHLGYGVRQKIFMVKRLDARDRLRFVATAGVKRAILELRKKDGTIGFDCLIEPWNNNRLAFKDVEVGEGSFTVSHQPHYMESSFAQIRYGVVDEERKINLNYAKREIIENLLEIVADLDESSAQTLSATIVDWRDRDSELSIPLGSAEDRYYRGLHNSYECKDDNYTVYNELFLVKDMTKEVFYKIKDYVTIYGNGSVNINTASYKVLSSLGLHRTVVDKILLYRCGDDAIEANADDKIFTKKSTIIPELTKAMALSESEVANLSNMVSSGILSTASTTFLISSKGELKNDNSTLRIECVFRRPSFEPDLITGELDAKGSILYWRE